MNSGIPNCLPTYTNTWRKTKRCSRPALHLLFHGGKLPLFLYRRAEVLHFRACLPSPCCLPFKRAAMHCPLAIRHIEGLPCNLVHASSWRCISGICSPLLPHNQRADGGTRRPLFKYQELLTVGGARKVRHVLCVAAVPGIGGGAGKRFVFHRQRAN